MQPGRHNMSGDVYRDLVLLRIGLACNQRVGESSDVYKTLMADRETEPTVGVT